MYPIGEKFGMLKIVERVKKDATMRQQCAYYKCKCDCGNEVIVAYKNFHSGHTTSCGCIKYKIPKEDKNNILIEHKAGIYMFVNIINNHKYIGKTKDLYKRYRQHYYYKDNNYKKEKPYKQLYQAFNKYGFENFDFIIIKQFDEMPKKEILSSLEEYYIKYYNSYKNGYNASDISSGGFYSQQHQEKCTQILNELNSHQKNFDHPNNKLSEELFNEIIDYAMKGAPASWVWNKIKDRVNITKGSFHNIYFGKHYISLLPDNWDERPKVFSNSKLWGYEVINIKQRVKMGETLDSIFNDYKDKISLKSLENIIKNKTYKNIKID